MIWGNIYEVEFEQPVPFPGMTTIPAPFSAQKIAATSAKEAIDKALQVPSAMPVSSVKLIVSGVQW